MKNLQLAFCLLFLAFGYTAQAQLDQNTNSVQFEIQEDDVPTPTGTTMPARKQPRLSIPAQERDPKFNMSSLPADDPEEDELDIRTTDGLLDSEKGKAPKAFTRDKEPTEDFARDQVLGEMKTGGEFVSIKYRDHEYVDGDKIRVFVNGDIVQSGVFLTGSFTGFVLTLEEGENIIEFEALNQGSSGPNTAELHVYDDNGFIVSAKEWNLLTGYKAKIRVFKE